MTMEYLLNLPIDSKNGSFIDKSVSLQTSSINPSFLLSNPYLTAVGLCSLSYLQSITASLPTLVIAISPRPVIFYQDVPYALEGNYLCGILSGDALSSIERRVASVIESSYAPIIPLIDAFPHCVRIAFPTGSDEDADPPMEFLDQLFRAISTSGNKKILFLGDAESPGPLSVALAATTILFTSPSIELSINNSNFSPVVEDSQSFSFKSIPSRSPLIQCFPENSTFVEPEIRKKELIEFERISILVGSLKDGMKAKNLVDEIFNSIFLFFDNKYSTIKTPIHRIHHHHALGNLDRSATWLGRYAALILFAHWHQVVVYKEISNMPIIKEYNNRSITKDGNQKIIPNDITFLKWTSLMVPDLVFGQLQAFSRRPASWWIFRPLNTTFNITNEEQLMQKEMRNAMKRIQSGYPLILHSSALILKEDNDPKEKKKKVSNEKRNFFEFDEKKESSTPVVISTGQIATKEQRKMAAILAKSFDRILWLNLRGEPYVHIGETSTYSLRDEATARRHLRAFVGVPSCRLGEIEERVADDVNCLLSHVCNNGMRSADVNYLGHKGKIPLTLQSERKKEHISTNYVPTYPDHDKLSIGHTTVNSKEKLLTIKSIEKHENVFFFREEQDSRSGRGKMVTTCGWPEGQVYTPAVVASKVLNSVFDKDRFQWVRIALPGDSKPSIENVSEILSAVDVFLNFPLAGKEIANNQLRNRLSIVVQCRSGQDGSRAIFCKAIIALVLGWTRTWQTIDRENISETAVVEKNSESLISITETDPVLLAIIRAAPHGRASWKMVQEALGDHLTHFQANTGTPRRQSVVRSRLFYLLAVGSFLLDRIDMGYNHHSLDENCFHQVDRNGAIYDELEPKLCHLNITEKNDARMLGLEFKNWMDHHKEITKMIQGIPQFWQGVEMLFPTTLELPLASKMLSTSVISNMTPETSNLTANTLGECYGTAVMDPGHILKDDHFIGCHRLVDASVTIPGAPNFRLKWWNGILMAGTGIPLLSGREDIARVIRNTADYSCAIRNNQDIQTTDEPSWYLKPKNTRKITHTNHESFRQARSNISTKRLSLLWINLREEPVVYLGNRPFVLRESRCPFENVITTGINAKDVERIENELSSFLSSQMDPTQPAVMVHGEAEEDEYLVSDNNESASKQNNDETIVQFEESKIKSHQSREETVPLCLRNNGVTALSNYRLSLVSIAEIQTPKDALSATIAGIDKLDYYRVPVSDERTPLPAAFDMIKAIMLDFIFERHDTTETLLEDNGSSLKNESPTGFISGDDVQKIDEEMTGQCRNSTVKAVLFHCQMGRGRTTTGLVLGALIIQFFTKYSLKEHLLSTDFPQFTGQFPCENDEGRIFVRNDGSGDSVPIQDPPMIRALVDLLDEGPLAKRIVDDVIDTFGDVQNLRLAIFSLPEGSQVQKDYLERYFYLICFGHFLFVDHHHPLLELQNGLEVSFVAWLRDRPHISGLANRIHRIESISG